MYKPIKPTKIVNGSHKEILKRIDHEVGELKNFKYPTGPISDGYHTFDELYHHRAILFASLLKIPHIAINAWKSMKHYDPEHNPMFKDMFVVGVNTPYGQATYHYDIDPYWEVFDGVPILDTAPPYDGHTSKQAIERIYMMCEFISKNIEVSKIVGSEGYHGIGDGIYVKDQEVPAHSAQISSLDVDALAATMQVNNLIRSFSNDEMRIICQGYEQIGYIPVEIAAERIVEVHNARPYILQQFYLEDILNLFRKAKIDKLRVRYKMNETMTDSSTFITNVVSDDQ